MLLLAQGDGVLWVERALWVAGYSVTDFSVFPTESNDWLGCWGHHMKSPGFKAIKEHQKVGDVLG